MLLLLFSFIANICFSQNSWFVQETAVINKLYSVAKINDKTLIAVGENHTIIKTTNSGINWNVVKIKEPIEYGFRMVFFVNNTGYIPYDGYMFLKSIDAGETWYPINGYKKSVVYQWYSYQKKYIQDANILSIFFLDENTGFASSANTIPSTDEHYGAYKTTDGGNHWKPIAKECNIMVCIYFKDYYNGFGGLGDIWKTENGGDTWYRVKSTHGVLTSFSFINSNTGFCISRGSEMVSNSYISVTYLLRTTDGGSSWQENYPSPYSNYFEYKLNCIKAISDKLILMVGNEGVILKSDNLGKTWETQTSNVNVDLFDICFTDLQTGYIVGDKGIVLKTTTAGE